VETFLDAAHNKKFQEKWMMPESRVKLTDPFYMPHLTVVWMKKLWCIPLEEQSG